MLIAEIFGLIGGTLGIAQGLPQAIKIRKSGHIQGVSRWMWIFTFASYTSWMTYGFVIDSLSIVATNALAVLVCASVVDAIFLGTSKARLSLLSALILIPLVFLLVPPLAREAILLFFIFSRVPQVITSFKNRKSDAHSAVSLQSLLLMGGSLGCWEIFAILKSEDFVVLTSTIAIILNFLIVYFEVQSSRLRKLTL